jgi:hypothetical protein
MSKILLLIKLAKLAAKYKHVFNDLLDAVIHDLPVPEWLKDAAAQLRELINYDRDFVIGYVKGCCPEPVGALPPAQVVQSAPGAERFVAELEAMERKCESGSEVEHPTPGPHANTQTGSFAARHAAKQGEPDAAEPGDQGGEKK